MPEASELAWLEVASKLASGDIPPALSKRCFRFSDSSVPTYYLRYPKEWQQLLCCAAVHVCYNAGAVQP